MPRLPAAQPLVDLLGQLHSVIEPLDVADYHAERARGISGSIGGHVRHTLDHINALLAGLTSGYVDYDARRRGTLIESQPPAALAEIRRLADGLIALKPRMLMRSIGVKLSVDVDDDDSVVASTVARELDFVVSHTIHHFAVMALLLRDFGVKVPERFGYARSTPTPAQAPESKCA